MSMIGLLVSSVGRGLITRFEGAPRMAAKKDMLGYYEIAYGNRYHRNGVPVKRGDTITASEVPLLLEHSMSVESGPIIAAMDHSTWHERDAFASLGYNCGGHNIVAQSRALRLHNSSVARFDVADAFSGGWYSGRSMGPNKHERQDAYYDGIWKQNEHDLRYVWIGPDGEPCEYQQLIRGLLRRRLAEGCVYLKLDFEQACRNEAVSLMRRRVWDMAPNGEYRWEDRVISRTTFADIYKVAKNYPLEDPREDPKNDIISPPVKRPVGDKSIIIVPTDHEFDDELPPKPIETSETFAGAVIEVIGAFFKRRAAQGGITGTVATSVLTLYLAVINNPVMMAAATTVVIAGIAGAVWTFGKIMESVGLRKKERGRAKGVQLKY